MKTEPVVASSGLSDSSRSARVVRSIRDAASLLPRQGPITKFAFLNPLMGLEHVHYDEVMRRVGDWYGNEAYLDDGRYRQKFWRGRIVEGDLREVLAEDLGASADESVGGLTPRADLRLAMLIYPLHFGHRGELDWVLAETEALQQFRPEVSVETRRRLVDENRRWIIDSRSGEAMRVVGEIAGRSADSLAAASAASLGRAIPASGWSTVYLRLLWRVIRQGVDSVATSDGAARSIADRASEPPDDATAAFRTLTSDPGVDELMIRFTAAFLDQGYAATRLPGVDGGYWASFKLLYSRSSRLAPQWRKSLGAELAAIERAGRSVAEVICDSLDALAVPEARVDEFIRATLLSLRGFAGMVWQTETRPDLFQKPSPTGTLNEFLAVRLLLLRIALRHPITDVVPDHAEPDLATPDQADPEQMAFLLFEIAQVLNWTPARLVELGGDAWRELAGELKAFGDHHRRRIFHAAFERRIAKMALRAVAIRAQTPPVRPERPSLQLVCCIDAREESLRRHLEELDASVETYGIAGFFGVAMYYRGAGDAGFSALCPIVMKPQHWVIEEAVYSLEESDRTRARARRWIGTAQKRFQAESRGPVGGAVVSTLVGPLATIPMLSRILFPRLTAMMNRTARQFIAPPAVTRLRLERSPEFPPAPPSGEFRMDETAGERVTAGLVGDEGLGFTLEEMAQMAEKALRDIGLTSRFAPLVVLLGHGSGCLNNPHESAYHCGACAGNAGGPNARALAVMLNDARVRRQLATSGLEIPESTHFLGAQHHTATEEIMFYDLELLPTTKIKAMRAAKSLLAEAARRNAHERCRRFESAALDMTPDEALMHVRWRSEDLAQTRPEYGNGSNAICFVGRRNRIRGLYLDRRSFLMSYDPTQDDAAMSILARILAAVVPVCQGINMLYSLSAIDPTGWGSGTKLPHNITSLVGVMDGAASDLRPGLPWQGVDIHEPVRLLFIIEATPRAILKIMAENPTIDRIIRNHWAHVATLDPTTGQMHRFTKDRFVIHDPRCDEGDGEGRDGAGDLPTAARSVDWYRGRRDHLPFAMITPPGNRVGGSAVPS